MSARLLDGSGIGRTLREEIRPSVDAFVSRTGRPPGLALVLVGNDPASELYVANKLKSAAKSGQRADLERLPADAALDELLSLVDRFAEGVPSFTPSTGSSMRSLPRRTWTAFTRSTSASSSRGVPRSSRALRRAS